MTLLESTAQPVTIARTMPALPSLLALLRPGQWPKNLFVVPLALLGTTWDVAAFGRVGLAVAAFIVASSLVYVVNDIADRKRDRLHPVKRHRPIASGQVSVPAAVVLAALLTAPLAVLVAVLTPAGAWPLLAYVGLNAAYTFKLKHFPLLDVFTVAAGFVLRLVGGYEAIDHPVAGWLLVCVLSLCLLLVLGKRHHELTADGATHRPALGGYSAQFLEQMLILCAGLAIVAYLLFLRTETGFGPMVFLTAGCALFALFRYLQIVMVHKEGADPVRILLHDPVMITNSLLWAGLLLIAHL